MRQVCPICRRPPSHCVCASAPRIDNRTPVFVLQHLRERRHPLNSVPLLRRALAHMTLEVWGARIPDAAARLETFRQKLPEGTALLYPSPGAPALARGEVMHPPPAILAVDGTWSQAKGFVRDIPWLAALPRYRLSTPTPGRYRLRAEPRPEAQSTLEAVVRALLALEPETDGLEELLATFDRLIDRHLPPETPRRQSQRRRARQRSSRAVPEALVRAGDHLVLGYAETCRTPTGPGLAFWAAIRLWDDAVIATAGDLPTFAERWRDFIGDAMLCTWTTPARALASLGQPAHQALKHVYCNLTHERPGPLEALVERLGLAPPELGVPGRPGRRLAATVALWRWLRARAGGVTG